VSEPGASWLLLIHQIPPKPSYVRVKVWRRLQALGAVSIKNSVYALPNTEAAREDFEWMLREIVKLGGEATVCEAKLVDGLSDEDVQRSFHAARDADYAEIAHAAKALRATLSTKAAARNPPAQAHAEVARLRKRLTDVARIDFFGAPGREAAEGHLSGVETKLRPDQPSHADRRPSLKPDAYRGRTWVTRTGIHIDRIASAWLIRRFIDPKARFKFVAGKGYQPKAAELRFDMFEAEFTHEGDCCTFEVLMARFSLDDRALGVIAEIVHDIDLKDAKFERPETPGVDRLIAGIAMANKDDEPRLAAGGSVFDALYEYFRRKKS
jgi:hypothetical protein